MKQFLKEMLIEPFTEGDWSGYIIGGIIWIFTIVIGGVLIWLCGWFIDSSFLPIKEKEGVVTEHYYIPAHTSTTYVMSGKILIPIINYIDDSYEITVDIGGVTDNICLHKDYWRTVKVGDTLYCEYTNGRICRTLYIKSLYSKR